MSFLADPTRGSLRAELALARALLQDYLDQSKAVGLGAWLLPAWRPSPDEHWCGVARLAEPQPGTGWSGWDLLGAPTGGVAAHLLVGEAWFQGTLASTGA
jgi:hypothetical protein